MFGNFAGSANANKLRGVHAIPQMLDLEEPISNMKIIHVAGTKGKVFSINFGGCLEMKPS